MKILYDHQVFTWQEYGGISRYYYELIKAQRGSAGLSLVHSNNEYIVADPELGALVTRKPIIARPSKIQRLFTSKKSRRRKSAEVINLAHSIEQLKAGAYDLFHPTYYDRYFIEHVGGRPFVLTVHDMIHELFPEHFQLRDPASAQKRELVQKAAHIIAVSECTKKDLMDLYGVAESRITVIYHGSSLRADGPSAQLVLPEKYFLLVGSRGTYKNCYFTVRALRDVLNRFSDVHLVFAGGGPFSEEERGFFFGLGLAERVHQAPAPDEALRSLYARAEAFIFPSLYEGFGIPTIEAFSCGCPVLSSDTAALKEVAGDAALYFEPKNVQSIQQAVVRILSEPGMREDLRKKGELRLQFFSWKKCAAQTVAVYEKVLGGSR